MKITQDLERLRVVQEKTGDQGSVNEKDKEELDLLPEFCHYRDEGCKLAPSCLECPFPTCVEDSFWGRQKQMKYLRDVEIFRLHESEALSTRAISRRFNLNLRTVERIVAARREQI